MENNKISAEERIEDLFSSTQSASGDEQILEVASKFATQLSMPQIKAICYMECQAKLAEGISIYKVITETIERYIQLKQFNHSDIFVMRALDSISLHRFIRSDAFKVDVKKQ